MNKRRNRFYPRQCKCCQKYRKGYERNRNMQWNEKKQKFECIWCDCKMDTRGKMLNYHCFKNYKSILEREKKND